MFETIIQKKLLERNDHTVEIFEGSGSNWRLEKIGNPGKLGNFEDILFASNDMQDTPMIITLQYAIHENDYLMGMAFFDLKKRTLGITEFLDDNQYSNLEYAMIALGCRECLLSLGSGKSTDNKHLHDILESWNFILIEKKKYDFKSRDVDQDLHRLVKGSIESLKDLVASSESVVGALGALLSYINFLVDDINYGKVTIENYHIGRFMRLNVVALRELNVLESKIDVNKNFSLFGLMNKTCTVGMGKRLLNRWLKKPLLDVEEIKCRLDMVQAFVEDASLHQYLRLHIKIIVDID